LLYVLTAISPNRTDIKNAGEANVINSAALSEIALLYLKAKKYLSKRFFIKKYTIPMAAL